MHVLRGNKQTSEGFLCFFCGPYVAQRKCQENVAGNAWETYRRPISQHPDLGHSLLDAYYGSRCLG